MKTTALVHLSDTVLMHVCRDGTITYRTRKEKNFNGASLPFYSVPDEETAKTLQTMLCSKQYTPHPKQPNRPWYVLTSFGGELDDIPKATERFKTAHELIKSRKAKP